MASTNQPPASNLSAGDATGGVASGAGGTSHTSAINSPVQTEQKTIVGTVLETLGLSSGPQEKRAEDITAHAPDTASSTIPASASNTSSTSNTASIPATTSTPISSSEGTRHGNTNEQTYAGTIAGALAAGSAAVSNYVTGQGNTSREGAGASTSVAGTGASSGSTTGSVTGLGSSTGATTGGVAGPNSSTGTTTGDVAGVSSSRDTGTGSIGGSSSSTGTTAGSVADSAASTAKAAGDAVKDTVTGSNDSEHKKGSVDDSKPAKVSDHQAAIRENKDAIPTAGGQRLGEGHWGESKVVPDVPKKQDDASRVSSRAGQPDQSTIDNTAKNTGGATEGPHKQGLQGMTSSNNTHEGTEEKHGLVDKFKHKLHLDKSDKQ